MDFSTVTEWKIADGTVVKVTDTYGKVIWQKGGDEPITVDTPFFFENVGTEDATITLVASDIEASVAPEIALTCSTDNKTYTDYDNTTGVTIPAGGKLYFKWKSGEFSNSQDNYHYFSSTGNVSANGNIMSLLYSDYSTRTTINHDYAFHCLLAMSNLIKADELLLPATTLATNCYSNLFNNCKSLVSTPILPATTLTEGCYGAMFAGCSSLTTPPSLPATTLAHGCYELMFSDCLSLATPPSLPATTLVERCYRQMFMNTKLTKTPVLRAETLAEQCYYYMFFDCSNLRKVTTYAKYISASRSLTNWLSGVNSTGNFYNLGGATYTSGDSGIPSGWTEYTSL